MVKNINERPFMYFDFAYILCVINDNEHFDLIGSLGMLGFMQDDH